MWRAWDYAKAFAWVASDKIYDYTVEPYYNNNENDEDNDSSSDEGVDDSIMDYHQVLEVGKYIEVEERGKARILPPVGYYEEYSTFLGPPVHIVDNIYLGSSFNAACRETLEELNIKIVFNISKEMSNYYPDDFTYHRCDLYDNNKHSILKHLKKAYEQIVEHRDHDDGNILIHCFMGASRSASVVIYYIMKEKLHDDGTPYTFEQALEFVKNKR